MTIDHHYVTLGLKLLNQELMLCNYFQAFIIQFLRINKYQGDFFKVLMDWIKINSIPEDKMYGALKSGRA